ncbi:MAG: hypothetical protein KDD52_04960 [Bdellovibrionales bacterium]|nr:hypothetical protein [Bdellovibrionales bacterium]
MLILCIAPNVWGQFLPVSKTWTQKPIHLIVKGYESYGGMGLANSVGTKLEDTLSRANQDTIVIGSYTQPLNIEDLREAARAVAAAQRPLVLWTLMHGQTLGNQHYLTIGGQNPNKFISEYLSDPQKRFKIRFLYQDVENEYWNRRLGTQKNKRYSSTQIIQFIKEMDTWDRDPWAWIESFQHPDFADPHDPIFLC